MVLETQNFEDPRSHGTGDSDLSENILPKGAILQNRYEVIKVLGVGGMGAVYLTRDLRFKGVKRMCAVKEMISTAPDPQVRRLSVQSFEREANILAQLRHPGIPTISDFFTEGIRSYLVMEYVDGQDLETILENTEGMLSEEVVLDWAIQICDVLVYLHTRKPPIIFRDLKPSNIMLRKENNRIALIDFGIAKVFDAGQKGTMIGTEGYSPPEQYKGIADPRGDIYALGATLHHLLTKRDPRLEPPFTFHEEPPRLLNPALSQMTNDIIMKMLEYDPDKRYQSALEVKQELEAALSALNNPRQSEDGTEQRQAGAVGGGAPATRYLADQPAPEAPPAGGGVPPTQPPPYPPPQQPYYPPPYGYPPQPYPGAYPPPYPPGQVPPMPGAAGQPGEELSDSILPIWKFKCEDEVRATPVADKANLYIGAYDNNVYALNLKNGKFQWKYPTEGGIATRPALYKNLLIFGSEDRVVYAITTSGQLAWTCPTEGKVRSSAVVEFDHAFFGSDDGRVYAINAQSGRIIWRFTAMGPVRSTPTLGEELVYIGSEDGHLYALDLSTGSARWKFRANRNVTSSPALSPDKELVVVGSADWHIYAVDASSGYSVWQVRTGQAVISSPVIYDGLVYIGSADKHLYAIDLKSGRVAWKYNANSPIVSTPAVTEEAVYFGTMAGEVLSIHRRDRKLRWRFKTDKPIPSSPIIVDGIVYIGAMDHHVYALPA
ncbi:MAG: protein kinase [Chloroflexi bacterium]|nr:MAG: protein kinase [Chloroflexota bacterium]